jgi:quercetin dioxygenase-like cupin family protein
MTKTIMSLNTTAIRWAEFIEYPQTGLKSAILLEDGNCRYTLMSLAMGMHVTEHCIPRNATVNVIEGQGVMTLEGKELVLESGVFIFIPANIRHNVKAISNLSFLLTLSEYDIDSSSPLTHSLHPRAIEDVPSAAIAAMTNPIMTAQLWM